jgi:hypothetical protein
MELAKSSRGVIYMKETLVNSFFRNLSGYESFVYVIHPTSNRMGCFVLLKHVHDLCSTTYENCMNNMICISLLFSLSFVVYHICTKSIQLVNLQA